MDETGRELRALQQLIDDSFARAGPHLAAIVTEDRRLTAVEVADYLQGIKHLVVATTTSEGHPRVSPVDGLFLHGAFWFSTSTSALKTRHLRRRPAVSAAHAVADAVAVIAHGDAELVLGGTPDAARLAPYWRDHYGGSTPEDWAESASDAVYVGICAHTLLAMSPDRAAFDRLGAAAPQ